MQEAHELLQPDVASTTTTPRGRGERRGGGQVKGYHDIAVAHIVVHIPIAGAHTGHHHISCKHNNGVSNRFAPSHKCTWQVSRNRIMIACSKCLVIELGLH